DPKTLQVKSTFKPDQPSPFASSPVVVQSGGKSFVAAGNADGRIYVLDSAGTLVTATEAVGGLKSAVNGLATWEHDRAIWLAACAFFRARRVGGGLHDTRHSGDGHA